MFPITIVSVMDFSLKIVATLTVVSLVSSIAAQLLMGRVVDKFSRIPLIFANRVMLCLIPVMYALFFSFHEFIILEVYSGFVGAIQSTVMTSYLMDVVPTEHKGEYMSILNGFNGGVYFAGAIIGGYLLTFFLTIYPLREALFAGYMIVFIGRFSSSLLFLRLEEVGDKGGRKSWPLYSILMRMRQPGAPSGGNLRPK
jgi:MFS family permease